MTDEEMAEEYKETVHRWRDSKGELVQEEDVKEAFLAGLKAGKDMADADLAIVAYMQGAERYKPKWHYLRKDPNDLPPLWEGCERTSIRVVDNYDRIITYDYDSERWRDYEGDSLGIQPDYWYEIPQFKDKE